MRTKLNLGSFYSCLSIAILASGIFLCSKEGKISEPVFISSITYGMVDSIELQLNIAIPAKVNSKDSKKYPLLIFIHGGGWRDGHRNAYNGKIKEAAKKGYVAATLSHRLTSLSDSLGNPLYPWPAALHDVKTAVKYLKSHCDKYKIDTIKIGATGASSGGHLALLLGLASDQDIPSNPVFAIGLKSSEPSTKIHAVVNISGPTDMALCWKNPIVKDYAEFLLEGSPNVNPEGYIEASPINYVSEESISVLTIHGVLDQVVPYGQALLLDSVMKERGANHELLGLKDQPHIFSGKDALRSWNRLYAFFDTHLKLEAPK